MSVARRLDLVEVPQDYSPKTIPEIMRQARRLSRTQAVVYCGRQAKPYLFETDRLIVRRFLLDDGPQIQRLAIDKEGSPMRYRDHRGPTDPEGCNGVARFFSESESFWAVCLKPELTLIGLIAYNSVDENGWMDLGHSWQTRYQDGEYDTEALSLMTQYAFEKLGVKGVYAHNPADWEPQIAPLRRIGLEIVSTSAGSIAQDDQGNPVVFLACRMEISRERWERLQCEAWEGYGPRKTPAIISRARNAGRADAAARNLPVKAAAGGFYVDGFPALRWGQWRDCTYGGAVTAILNAVGIGAAYEQVMGVCGACYRISMLDDWDPSATMPQNGAMAEEAMNRAFGVDVYSIADEAARDANVVRSLEGGVPVLACGQRAAPEWTVITGYARRGGEPLFFGRTYFDYENAEQDEVFTGNGYRLADRYPGEYPQALLRLYDRRCEPLPALDALRVSLEMCMAVYEQADSRYGHRFGERAYDILIRGFGLSDEEYARRCGNDQYHIGSLMDARRAAHAYLEGSAALLVDDSRGKLLAVAALYREIVDALLAAVPYEGTSAVFAGSAPAQDRESRPAQHHFPPVGNAAPVWDAAARTRLAGALRQAVELERQVRVLVRGILDDWG
ncbi:MAG: GNAT family N-acetyltransferase [Anaerolineae bacterium]